jgi:predicted RNA-binding protein associated with RNAse of E/G family
MGIQKKYMKKQNWKRVTEREYISNVIEEENIRGVASLLFIKKVEQPSFKEYKNKITVKIADEKFYWLQLAIENENYWITAMYDENKKLIQYYIDITEKNVIDTKEDSYFYDLFLDVVILNTGEIILLDEDELEEALKEKVINHEQYELAYNKAKNIMEFISKEKDKLEYFCNKYFNQLLSQLQINKK